VQKLLCRDRAYNGCDSSAGLLVPIGRQQC